MKQWIKCCETLMLSSNIRELNPNYKIRIRVWFKICPRKNGPYLFMKDMVKKRSEEFYKLSTAKMAVIKIPKDPEWDTQWSLTHNAEFESTIFPIRVNIAKAPDSFFTKFKKWFKKYFFPRSMIT